MTLTINDEPTEIIDVMEYDPEANKAFLTTMGINPPPQDVDLIVGAIAETLFMRALARHKDRKRIAELNEEIAQAELDLSLHATFDTRKLAALKEKRRVLCR
jgi:hypothetical protein